jgi:N6-L-threonylcarbamoyladenine synthase
VKILAIETSCDDTGIAVLEISKKGDFTVLSNVVSSQAIHQNYGGVFPAMAKREHQKNIIPVFKKALKEANLLESGETACDAKELEKILDHEAELFKQIVPFFQKTKKPDIDAIAIVNGPGLEPCLWVGVNFARAISMVWNIPLIPVNHIESHILVNILENPKINFPALSLVVSGGHTQLILVKKIGNYKIVGETRDDAAGECFDKCAKILGLGYPGGPLISKMAKEFKGKKTIALPRPMMNTNDYDFSFSGLKTAVLYKDRDTKKKGKKYNIEMAHEVQDAIVDVLLKKTFKAAKDLNVKTIILGGGVSANQELRSRFAAECKTEKLGFIAPPPHLSTDNALMSAVTGYFHKNKKASWKTLEADANLRV